MSHRDGEARARRHVRQRVRTIDTPSAATQHRATVARTQCSLTQQHQQLHVQHQQHLRQQQHLRHHRHQRVRARARTHARATTADPTPQPANSAGAASAHRCTLHCTRTTKRPAATLPLSFADKTRSDPRGATFGPLFRNNEKLPALFRNGKIAAPPAPVSRNNTAWTPRPRPASIVRIPHVGWSLGPQAHPTHCRLRRAAGYQAHPVTSARPRRRRRAGASPTPAERIYRRPYRLPHRPPSSAAVIYMCYLVLRFYLLVVYYLCQSSDPSLSEPRPPPSVPPRRCAHPPAAPAPCPPRAPARST